MRDPHPWICDIDKTHKQESNNWLLGSSWLAGFSVIQWDEEAAERDYQGEKKLTHLCGVECVQKWCTQQLGKLYNAVPAKQQEQENEKTRLDSPRPVRNSRS